MRTGSRKVQVRVLAQIAKLLDEIWSDPDLTPRDCYALQKMIAEVATVRVDDPE